MIYFVQLDSRAIKFGFTEYLMMRLATLRSQHSRVKLLHAMEGDADTEEQLHERFNHLRIGNSDQFRPGPDLMKFIGEIRLAPPKPVAVEAGPRKETGRWIFTINLGPRAIRHLITAQGGELNN